MEQALTTIRPELLSMTHAQMAALGPWIWAVGGSLVMMLASVLFKSQKGIVPTFLILFAAGAAWSSGLLMDSSEQLLFNRMMAVDRLTLVSIILFSVAAIVTTLVSMKYLDREGLQHPEYYILMLFSMVGMMNMVSALDLVVIFIALELMSISVYVLVGFRRADRRSNEAAVKYFVLGGAASAIFLYGTALLYGATGSIQLQEILSAARQGAVGGSMLFVLGAALVLFGFLFKVAAFPFHMWMPDVYEGAPAPITGFMTTGIKAASFVTFVRVLDGLGYANGLGEALQRHLHDILWLAAALTMLIGNLVALAQVNLKRMLAYSSIAHTGYLLVGLVAGAGQGPVFLYLLAYTLMNLGAFAVLSVMARRGDAGVNLHDMAGLAQRRPFLALAMSIFLFSMAGVPPTAGFAAKYLLLSSAVQSGEIWLTVIAVLCSAISVYYYLRVLVFMYMREPAAEAGTIPRSWMTAGAILAMVLLTLQIGVFPSSVVETARSLQGSAALVHTAPAGTTAAR